MAKELSLVCLVLLVVMLLVTVVSASARVNNINCRSKKVQPIQNGRVKYRMRGRIAKFNCRRGFKMFDGDQFATCIHGKWRGRIPKCIASGCQDIGTFLRGHAIPLYDDAVFQFLCQPGYLISSPWPITCDGINWNGTKPVCQVPEEAATSCDFEGGGLCGWSNAEDNYFDWIRHKGPTSSFGMGTGPKEDHTLGTPEGHYMYVDSSLVASGEGSWGRLFSPVYTPDVSLGHACFTFYYHMYGSSTGYLYVYQLKEDERIDSSSPISQMSGFNHDRWFLIVLQLEEVTSNFQIVIVAIWGDDYMSDIAIDDVHIAHGAECQQLQETFDFPNTANATSSTTPWNTVTMSPAIPSRITDTITTDSSTSADTMILTSPTDIVAANTTDTLFTEETVTKSPEESFDNNTNSPSVSSSVSSLSSALTEVSIMISGSEMTVLDNISTSNTSPLLISSDTTVPSYATSNTPILKLKTTPQTSSAGKGSEEDLQSCKGRCGEIAMDEDACGCDRYCHSDNRCCSDVSQFCDDASTPRQLSTTSLAGFDPNSPLTLSPPSVPSDKDRSSSPVARETTVPTLDEGITYNSSATAETTRHPNTDDFSTTTLQEQETPTAISSATDGVLTIITTTLDDRESAGITKEIKETTPTSSTMVSSSISQTEMETNRADQTKVMSDDISTPLNDEATVETLTELPKTDTSLTNPSSAPSKENHDETNKGTTFIIAIAVVVGLILVAVVVVVCVRKVRQDKLPDDSDIRFLARDEVQMDGNVFSLSSRGRGSRGTPV